MAILDRIFKQDFRLSHGRATLINRFENVRSAIEHRFSVYPLSIPFRPAYGAQLKRYSNEPLTIELEQQIIKEIRNQMTREKRIKTIRKITVNSTDEGSLKIEVDVILLGTQEALQFNIVI